MVSDTLLIQAKQYLLDILGSEAVSDAWAKPWVKTEQLPFFLQNAYTYYQAELFGQSCLLMRAAEPEGKTPAVVRKHWQAVAQQYKGAVIYIVATVTSYDRKRLIEHKVPFLIPGNQLYLPELGVDLREYFKPGRRAPAARLSAPAQALLLRQVLKQDCSGLPAKNLALMLGYSRMTITRAIKELTDHHLAMAEKVGREKHLRFSGSGRSLWEAAQSVLQSPVTKRMWVIWRDRKTLKPNFAGRLAGESALAHYTDLADTNIGQLAITPDAWSAMAKRNDVQILESQPPGHDTVFRKDWEMLELELWAYNPEVIMTDKPWIDPLSLWLSFTENTDERLELARDALLEQVWSTLPW